MPEGWKFAKISALLKIQTGASFKKDSATTNPKLVRVLRGGNILNGSYNFFDNDIYLDNNLVSDAILLQRNDLITPAVTSIENIGKIARIEQTYNNVTAGGFVFILRPYYQIDELSKYLLYALQSSYFNKQLKAITKKSGQAFYNLGKERLLQLILPIPPLAEQARIVAEIEKFEPLIAEYDKLEQQATKLDDEIYDKLKKSILQYAIQGKLVPQDPNDEPASVLLERIRAEKKAKLGKKYVDSYIYKGDDNCYYEHIAGRSQDEMVEVPFDIPDNWAWAKLLDLGCFSSGKTPDMSAPAYWQNGNVQWFTSKDMKTKYLAESQLKITELAANDMTLYPANTLLWVVRSGILKSSLPICILKQPATINQDIKAYQLYQLSMIDYVYYMLKGMEARILDNYVKRITTVHSLKFDELISKLVVPIPPFAEQNRIVAKINEIFSML